MQVKLIYEDLISEVERAKQSLTKNKKLKQSL